MADGCGNPNFEASSNNNIKVKTVGDERYDFSTFKKKKTNTSRRSYRQRSLRQQQFGGSLLVIISQTLSLTNYSYTTTV